jgi:periplasmic divalent cation tolerance protein
MKILEVFVTFPDKQKAAEVARLLVEARLAACVNILDNVRSVYRWEGQVEEGSEVLAIIKTTGEHWEKLCETIHAHHPYTLPAITAVEVAQIPGRVRHWILESLNMTNGNYS